MFILGQFFASLAILFSMIFKVIYFLLVIRIIISWFRVDTFSEPISILYKITDPILLPFRKLPLQIGMVDFSPIIAFIVVTFLDSFIVGVFQRLAYQFS